MLGFITACRVQNRAEVLHLRYLLMPRMSHWRLMVISAFWRATSSRNLEVPLLPLPAACTSFPYICTTSKSFLKHGLKSCDFSLMPFSLSASYTAVLSFFLKTSSFPSSLPPLTRADAAALLGGGSALVRPIL